MKKSNLCNSCDIDDCTMRDSGEEVGTLSDLIDGIVQTLISDAPAKEPDFEEFDRMSKEIMDYYKFPAQLKKLVEEIGELNEAIQDYYNPDVSSESAQFNLMDEIADVYILIHQIVEYLGAAKFNDRIEYKLRRQVERIRKERASDRPDETTCI